MAELRIRQTDRATALRRRTREEHSKVESNDSLEIADKRFTSNIPGLLSGWTTICRSRTEVSPRFK